MKVSDELKYQLDQFSRMRSCHLNEQLKRELAIWYSENNFGTLNTKCSTCVRIAMDRMNAQMPSEHPKLVHFTGIKVDVFNPESASIQELKKMVKAKGLNSGKNATKIHLINLLKQ
jgi:hypothetical protein